MTGFLTMYGRKVDPAIPDGNCLFQVLSMVIQASIKNYGTQYLSFHKILIYLEVHGQMITAQQRNMSRKCQHWVIMVVMQRLKLRLH